MGRAELEQLIALKKRFKSEIKITIPTWEAGEYDLPSCPLGRDFLVIGPEGNVAACVLLLHGGLYTTNIFQEDSLASAWEKIRVFAFKEAREPLFSDRSSFPLSSDLRECQKCRLFETHRCFGGCVARARLFGHPFEINRQCQGPLN